MFCSKCGATVPEESGFCLKCGSRITTGGGPAAPARDDEDRKDGGGGFWRSGAGIAVMVILGLTVLAVIIVGMIALAKSGGEDDKCDAETIKVWEEYESLLEKDSDDIPDLTLDKPNWSRPRRN